MEEGSLTNERIPVTLIQIYLDKGHHLYGQLLHFVAYGRIPPKNGTHVIGTIRDNRKNFPTNLKSLNLYKGAAAFYEHDDLLIAKYRARKDKSTGKLMIVHVLCTAHTPAMGNTSKKDKEGNILQKPTCIIAYNHNTCRVDLMDQQLDGIEVLRNSCKWYKKLFLRIVMQCALSLHMLYNLKGGKDVFLYHLLDVCTHLFFIVPRLEMRRPAIDNIARLKGRNCWPRKREVSEDWKDAKSKVKICNTRGKKT